MKTDKITSNPPLKPDMEKIRIFLIRRDLAMTNMFPAPSEYIGMENIKLPRPPDFFHRHFLNCP